MITGNRMHRSANTSPVWSLCIAMLSLAVLGSCHGREVPSEVVANRAIASTAHVAEFMPSLTDVSTRILPSLADANTAQLLARQLGDLKNALESRDAPAAARHLAAMRSTIAAYPPEHYAHDAAELSAIEVTLNHTAQITGRAARPIGEAP